MIENELPQQALLEIGPLKIDQTTCQVSYDGQVLSILGNDYKALLFLTQNANRVVTKEALKQALNGKTPTSDNAVRNIIKRLRHCIERNPDSPSYILTVRGLGYMIQDTTSLSNG